jgi:predicted nucleic acid-binding protein
MTPYYLDTSALIKRYVAEVGSRWIITLANSTPNPLLFTSRLTIVEVRSVLARRKREASINSKDHAEALAAFYEDSQGQYRFIELDTTIVELASELLDRYPLRAYDSVQLATALRINQTLEAVGLTPPIFLSADDRLLSVAEAENLPTDNPNRHL